jgi:hypothetical protein
LRALVNMTFLKPLIAAAWTLTLNFTILIYPLLHINYRIKITIIMLY